jgi:hypothetical protein
MEIWSKLKLLKGAAAAAKAIYVHNPPKSFDSCLSGLKGVCDVKRSLKPAEKVSFLVVFALSKEEIEQLSKKLDSWTPEGEDCVVWFAYPKKSSRQLKSDVSRDDGFQVIGSAGFEPVSSVSIDDDWSALRFRRVEFIKTMTRAFAHTKEGKQKVEESRKRGISCGVKKTAGKITLEKDENAEEPTKKRSRTK